MLQPQPPQHGGLRHAVARVEAAAQVLAAHWKRCGDFLQVAWTAEVAVQQMVQVGHRVTVLHQCHLLAVDREEKAVGRLRHRQLIRHAPLPELLHQLLQDPSRFASGGHHNHAAEIQPDLVSQVTDASRPADGEVVMDVGSVLRCLRLILRLIPIFKQHGMPARRREAPPAFPQHTRSVQGTLQHQRAARFPRPVVPVIRAGRHGLLRRMDQEGNVADWQVRPRHGTTDHKMLNKYQQNTVLQATLKDPKSLSITKALQP